MKLAKKMHRNRHFQQYLATQRAFHSHDEKYGLSVKVKSWTESYNADQCLIELYYRGRKIGGSWRSVSTDRSNPSIIRVKYDAASPWEFFYNDTQWNQWIESLGPRLTN